MRVELPGNCYVAVAVESLDKFLSYEIGSAQRLGEILEGSTYPGI